MHASLCFSADQKLLKLILNITVKKLKLTVFLSYLKVTLQRVKLILGLPSLPYL
jgi:hypothetical protein